MRLLRLLRLRSQARNVVELILQGVRPRHATQAPRSRRDSSLRLCRAQRGSLVVVRGVERGTESVIGCLAMRSVCCACTRRKGVSVGLIESCDSLRFLIFSFE